MNPGALNTFWRSAENFQSNANYAWNTERGGMLWAASQAAALRRLEAARKMHIVSLSRLIVSHDLELYEFRRGDLAAGFSSGGFMGPLSLTRSI